MVERVIRPARNGIDFGENEDDCSSAFNVGALQPREKPRRFYAD